MRVTLPSPLRRHKAAMSAALPAPRPSLTPAAAVAAAIAALDGTLVVAKALVEGGRRIDLAGLDRDAVALCAAVMALDAAEAKPLRPALEALRGHVEGLAAAMRGG